MIELTEKQLDFAIFLAVEYCDEIQEGLNQLHDPLMFADGITKKGRDFLDESFISLEAGLDLLTNLVEARKDYSDKSEHIKHIKKNLLELKKVKEYVNSLEIYEPEEKVNLS